MQALSVRAQVQDLEKNHNVTLRTLGVLYSLLVVEGQGAHPQVSGIRNRTEQNVLFDSCVEDIKSDLGFFLFFRPGVTNTPRGGVVNCAQVTILGIPFRSRRTLGAHPSPNQT